MQNQVIILAAMMSNIIPPTYQVSTHFDMNTKSNIQIGSIPDKMPRKRYRYDFIKDIYL